MKHVRWQAAAAIAALLVSACAVRAPSATTGTPSAPTFAPSAPSLPPLSAMPSPSPAVAWSSVTRTKPIVGGDLFGGDGNQFMFALTGYRDGFIAVGEDCCGAPPKSLGVVWSSPDGTTWKRIEPEDVFGKAVVEHVATDGSRIIAIGFASGKRQSGEQKQTIVWLSDDGLAWRRSDAAGQAFTDSFRPEGVAGGPSGFVAWGRTASGEQHVARSPDGEIWSDVGFADAHPGTEISGILPWRGGLTAVGGDAVDQAFAVGQAKAWYSTDAGQWFPSTVDGFALRQVVAGTDGLLALGAGSGCGGCVGPPAIWHSDDGRSWQSLGPDRGYASYASDGIRIIRVEVDTDIPKARNTAVETSLDGVHWTSLAEGLAGGQNLGLAVGSMGILLIDHVNRDGVTDQVDVSVVYLPAKTD